MLSLHSQIHTIETKACELQHNHTQKEHGYLFQGGCSFSQLYNSSKGKLSYQSLGRKIACTWDPVLQLHIYTYAELHWRTSNCTSTDLLCTPHWFSCHCLQCCYLQDLSLLRTTGLKLNSRSQTLYSLTLLFCSFKKKKKKKEVEAEGSITEGSCIAPGGGETYKLWIRVTICLLFLLFYKINDVFPLHHSCI